MFYFQDERYFLSGSLDGKLRLWFIPDKKVALWNEVEKTHGHATTLITALTVVRNGKFVVVGTFDGRCAIFTTDVCSLICCIIVVHIKMIISSSNYGIIQ